MFVCLKTYSITWCSQAIVNCPESSNSNSQSVLYQGCRVRIDCTFVLIHNAAAQIWETSWHPHCPHKKGGVLAFSPEIQGRYLYLYFFLKLVNYNQMIYTCYQLWNCLPRDLMIVSYWLLGGLCTVRSGLWMCVSCMFVCIRWERIISGTLFIALCFGYQYLAGVSIVD